MRWHSGLFLVIALAIACRIVVLPAFGGDTIRPRWPLPMGQIRSMIRVIMLPGSVSRRSLSCGYSGTSLAKSGLDIELLGVEPVDLVQADQGVELLPALPLARLPDRALDDVALTQAVLAHLGQGDVDVVRPGQVAGGAHEGVALALQHVQDAGDRDQHVILGDHGLRVGLAVAPPVPVAVPVAAAAPSPFAVVVTELLPGGPAAGRRRLPAITGLVAAVPAAVIAAALVAAALVAAIGVPAGLLPGGLVPAARLLVVAAPVAAPPVAALRVTLRAVAGLRAGLLVEAELLPGPVRAEAGLGGGGCADAGRGAVADARSGECVWLHGVLSHRAGRVGSRGRGTLVRTLLARGDDPPRPPRKGTSGTGFLTGTSALPGLDGLNELALTHPACARDAQRLGDPYQVGHDHRGKASATATARRGRRLRRSCRRGGRRVTGEGIPRRAGRAAEDFGCVAH